MKNLFLTRRQAALRQVCVHRNHGDGSLLGFFGLWARWSNDRNRLHARGCLFKPGGCARVNRLLAVECLLHLGSPLRANLLSHEVSIKKRGGAGWSGVRRRDELSLVIGNPHHDVGHREVGQQLPVAQEHCEPLDVKRRCTPFFEEVAEN
ncbi:unannotated protein [freshwater metagenome]|uniref:Unannotated protein n=1 Tax=freshwater metagenome TaxID=449393 RepID=A0A6J6E2Q5_9ZZZZ